MRRVNLIALLRFEDDGLVDVGSMEAIRPEEIIEKIKEKDEKGEIELKDQEKIWVVPEESLIEHNVVPTRISHQEEDLIYRDERDEEKGEIFIALKKTDKKQYRIKGRVKSINSKKAARLGASFIGGNLKPKKVTLIPEQTINIYTI